MGKSLIKFVLLAGLAGGASGLPGLLGGLSEPGGFGQALPLPSASRGENSRELGRELAGLGSAVADLQRLAAGETPPAAPQGLSAEEAGLMRDAAPRLKFRSNALTRAAGLAGGGPRGRAVKAAGIIGRLRNAQGPRFQTFSDYRGRLLDFYAGHQAGAAYALWLAPSAAVLLSFLLLLLKRYTLGMTLAGALFAACNFVIWGLSASVLLSIPSGHSLLAALPREVWLSPVLFLVTSAGLLHLADENYPFWNRTLGTLLTPIAASCAAAFWPAGKVYLKSLAGRAVT